MNDIAKGAPGGRRLSELISLVDEIITVTKEENRVLAKGLSTSRPGQLLRKLELASELECWARDVSAKRIDFKPIQEPILSLVAARTTQLQTVTEENMRLLRGAIEASQRRIEAVMQAIRGAVAGGGRYTATGRPVSAVSSCAMSVRL